VQRFSTNQLLEMAGRRQNKGKKVARKRQPGLRSRGAAVLGQGVGAAPIVPFGSNGQVAAYNKWWDATTPAHLPLPRSVGPYCVVRNTRLIRTSSTTMIFGTFQSFDGAREVWTNVCAIGAVTGSDPINGASNTYRWATGLAGLSAGTSMIQGVPSALTVQVLNGNALQTTAGIITAGVMKTQANIRGRTESWNAFNSRFISYMSPRLLSAGKLALRGVKVSSYPLSMSHVSEFLTLEADSDAAFTYIDTHRLVPVGWAPIVVTNENITTLDYLVTTEWRVRFDLGNPASSSHQHHRVTSDSFWDRCTRSAAAAGHGVMDIVETIANSGVGQQMIGNALGYAGNRARLSLMNAGGSYLPMLEV